jgi:hypothetical protein
MAPGWGPRVLIAGDRDSGQRAAQVPGIVSGAYGYRIVPAILIIPSARGLQGNGEAIPAVYEGNAAARLNLAILVYHLIRAGLHPGAVGPICNRP